MSVAVQVGREGGREAAVDTGPSHRAEARRVAPTVDDATGACALRRERWTSCNTRASGPPPHLSELRVGACNCSEDEPHHHECVGGHHGLIAERREGVRGHGF